MDTLLTVYIEDIETGGQNGFKFFEEETEANNHFQKVRNDIIKHGKESEYKAVKREVNYDKQNNRVSFS